MEGICPEWLLYRHFEGMYNEAQVALSNFTDERLGVCHSVYLSVAYTMKAPNVQHDSVTACARYKRDRIATTGNSEIMGG